MHLKDFNSKFTRLTGNLRRAALGWDHHVSALDCDPASGRLHRHVVTIGGPFLPHAVLERHAARLGLGNVDIRQIRPTRADRQRRAVYVANNGLHFARVHASCAPRIEPFSRSRG